MQDTPFKLHETLAAASPLTVVAAGRYRAQKNQDYPAHFHNALEIVVFQTGQIQCLVGETLTRIPETKDLEPTFTVPSNAAPWNAAGSTGTHQLITTRPGLVLVMPPHTIHADRALSAYSHQYLLLELGDNHFAPKTPLTFMDDLDRHLEQVMNHLIREWQTNGANRQRMIELLLAQLQIHCERLETDPTPSNAEQLVRRAERLLEEHAAHPQSITQVAEQLNISPSALRAHFAKLRPHSPKTYQQQLRLNRALELIRSSSLSLEDIAGLTGYDSASHLSRHIKASTGLTPGRFRLKAEGQKSRGKG
jgi:AraC-like DNA-binding protein